MESINCEVIDKVAYARHRQRFAPGTEFAQTVNALINLAIGGRVSLIVSPPLSVDDRKLVHRRLALTKQSAAMFEEQKLEVNGREFVYELIMIA
jgi:hypothetical protein